MRPTRLTATALDGATTKEAAAKNQRRPHRTLQLVPDVRTLHIGGLLHKERTDDGEE